MAISWAAMMGGRGDEQCGPPSNSEMKRNLLSRALRVGFAALKHTYRLAVLRNASFLGVLLFNY